ncbi:MAG: helix-turn-helix transcriptional regulator, partial [Eubacterium sp.]|nr:helix-turn-helix transcriptional regulator [Eubacterium sp.]
MNNIKSGLFIKEKRNKKNLTQKELAELLNCTDKAISRWETGKGFPEVSFLIPLSEALDVSVNEIILGESIKNEQIIEKTDDVLVKTIKTSNKKINTANLIEFGLLILMEAYAFYIFPLSGDVDNGWIFGG